MSFSGFSGTRSCASRRSRLLPRLFAGVLLSGCLGDSNTPWQYSRQTVFGDSLSDVGSYAVGAIAAVYGGKFTREHDIAQYAELGRNGWRHN